MPANPKPRVVAQLIQAPQQRQPSSPADRVPPLPHGATFLGEYGGTHFMQFGDPVWCAQPDQQWMMYHSDGIRLMEGARALNMMTRWVQARLREVHGLPPF